MAGLLVLDTACQRTCCGVAWLRAHVQLLRRCGVEVCKHEACKDDRFQLGKGDPVIPRFTAYLPASVGGKRVVLGAGVLDANIPLLGSNELLDRLGLVLDLPNKQAYFKYIDAAVPVEKLNGHLTVRVADLALDAKHGLCWKRLQESVDWNDPLPELIAGAAARALKLLPARLLCLRMFREPPAWMQRWRRLMLSARYFRQAFWINLVRSIRLGVFPMTAMDSCPEGDLHAWTSTCATTLRQQAGKLQQMQEVQPKVEMEQRSRSLGRARRSTNFLSLLCAAAVFQQHGLSTFAWRSGIPASQVGAQGGFGEDLPAFLADLLFNGADGDHGFMGSTLDGANQQDDEGNRYGRDRGESLAACGRTAGG